MAGTSGETEPERAQTDKGLRTERTTTDKALIDNQSDIEDKADRVVERARENADALLDASRERADERLESGRKQAIATVKEERIAEDITVREERAAADAALRAEREETRKALARLLPLERGETDRHLLTERRRADLAVEKRDDFLGMVGHDLRHLLGGIVLSAAHLTELSPANETSAARIERFAARMNRLIGDLLDVASIDAGQFAVTPVRADLAPVIDEVLETFQASAAAKKISLTSDVHPPLIAAFDHDRIFQVLANVITNAIKFTPSGGAIRIGAERLPSALQLTFSDTGIGIPAEMSEAIFERFWQVGKNDRRGLGLGLYISRCIVEAHGGSIRAETPESGEKGARIVVTLPA